MQHYYFYLIMRRFEIRIYVLSLSYLRMLSDELFFKSNRKIGLKTSKKGPGAAVIVKYVKLYVIYDMPPKDSLGTIC